MAGPGGGPPRKSHTKSRKGCKTCKRRHIRCDETFPQCRNCTKHNCRCDYMDMPAASDEPARSPQPPDLLMTPDIERELDTWRMTGEPPFPELRFNSRTYWHRFSTIDLRLIHHIAGLSIDMHQRGYSRATVWAQKMPIFLAIGLSSEFVMSAVLALSASHLAWQTKNSETEHLAYHYRGVALKGLHEAIGAFARENSEAILAASMLLSWQATEWRSWASLQQGVSTVLNAMHAWVHESDLASYLETQRSIGRARTPVTPTLPPAQAPLRAEDLGRLDRATAGLQELRQRLANNDELSDRISELLQFLQELRRDFPLQAPEEAFERLQKLRSWLFWLPPAMLRSGESDLGALAVLAQFFGIALALEPLFPEIGGAYLGTMSVAPIEEMQRILLARRASHPPVTGIQAALSLMEIPMQMVSEYKARQHYLAPNAESYRASPHSSYATPNIHLASTPEMPPLGLYSNSPMPSPGLAVPGSPYLTPGVHSLSTRRASGYAEALPSHRPQMGTSRSISYEATFASSPAAYSPRYQAEHEMTSDMGYRETPAFQSYGANTGFVTPAQLWT